LRAAAPPETSPLSLHDALPIYRAVPIGWRARLAGWARKAQLVLVASGIFLVVVEGVLNRDCFPECWDATAVFLLAPVIVAVNARSEEHTSELQSRFDLVCRLLL